MNNRLSKPRLYETLLFLALLSGPPRLRARDQYASLAMEVDWSVLLSAAVWGLGATWVFFHLGGYVLLRKSIPRVGALHVFAFLLVACLYLSMVVSPAPPLTFYRVSQILIAILFGFFWLRRFGIDSVLKHLLGGYLLVSVAIGVAAFVAPELVFTDETRLRGDSIANTGAVAAMGIITLLSYPVIKRRALYLIILPSLATLLVMSQTRAAYMVMVAFVLLALAKLPRSKPLRSFLYSLSVLVPIGVMLQLTSVISEWLVRDQESLSTLSDRIPLWQTIVSAVMEQSPWIGLGFYANREITSSYNVNLGTSHSAFLEIFSGGGIIGSLIFGVVLVVELILITKVFLLWGKRPEVFTIVALFFATMLIGVTSEEMVIASPTSFTFWMLLSLIPMVHARIVGRSRVGKVLKNSSGSRALSATRR